MAVKLAKVCAVCGVRCGTLSSWEYTLERVVELLGADCVAKLRLVEEPLDAPYVPVA